MTAGRALFPGITFITALLFSSDLFEKMVPMAVQQSMSVYNQRKAETVNRLVGTMREATNLCNGYAALYTPHLCSWRRLQTCSCVPWDFTPWNNIISDWQR